MRLCDWYSVHIEVKKEREREAEMVHKIRPLLRIGTSTMLLYFAGLWKADGRDHPRDHNNIKMMD